MRDKDLRLGQPTLEEMLADPIVWTVMKADGIDEQELRNLLESVAADLAAGSGQTPDTQVAADPTGGYRRGVGIMLLNQRNEVLVGQRADTRGGDWQMPQGGINHGEDPRSAAFRELREEIGTDNVRIVAESKAWLRYDFPAELPTRWNGRWQGQQQKWFVMRFRGSDADINVGTEHPEFSAWKWVPIGRLPDLIVSFKRQLYLDLLTELRESGAVVHDDLPRPPGQ
jgi:8-oxo-dGTP pyrophosphatase MutT (NUDIX family)